MLKRSQTASDIENILLNILSQRDFSRNMLNLGKGLIRSVSGKSGKEFLNDRDR